MPWFPDFASAVELARRQTRAAGQADPVAQYFAALNKGDTRALETVWPGEVVIYDPRAGEIRGHRQLRRFVSQNQSWLTERHARIETVASTSRTGGPWWRCWRTWQATRGNWPGRSRSSPNPPTTVGGVPHLLQPVAGRRDGATCGRPSSSPGAARPGDVVGRYQAALAAGDTEAIVSAFEPDGYYREPIGPHYSHRGTRELPLVLHQVLQRGRRHRPPALRRDRRRRALRPGIQLRPLGQP